MFKIAISGKMCSGKSTLARILQEQIKNKTNKECTIESFANKIKELAIELFNVKQKDRKLLQQIGMKMREINKDVWTLYVINKHTDNIIIDDLRFNNELKFLKENNYYLIRINIDRKLQETRLKKIYCDSKNHIQRLDHCSEIELDKSNNFDYTFETTNNTDLEEVAQNIFQKIIKNR